MFYYLVDQWKPPLILVLLGIAHPQRNSESPLQLPELIGTG